MVSIHLPQAECSGPGSPSGTEAVPPTLGMCGSRRSAEGCKDKPAGNIVFRKTTLTWLPHVTDNAEAGQTVGESAQVTATFYRYARIIFFNLS